MRSRKPVARLLALTFAAAATCAAASFTATTPVKNFSLPKFTPQGHRLLHLRGSEAIQRGDLINVTGMNLTLFSGDADNAIDAIILSPVATFIPSANVAKGEESVRLLRLRENMEITGEEWTYDHNQQKVTIARNTRVVFRSPLPDLLK